MSRDYIAAGWWFRPLHRGPFPFTGVAELDYFSCMTADPRWTRARAGAVDRICAHLACALVVVLCSTGAGAQEPTTTLLARIDSLVNLALTEGQTPGISIAVARGRDMLVARGYGWADLERRVPATPETIYHIGSVTKEFTAAAVLRLAEARQLRLDDDLTRFLPDYPTAGRRITVRHLLSHTSGIRNYTNLAAKWAARAVEHPDHSQMVALFEDEPLEFAPGTRFSYNNSGYYLLGLIIERVSGEPYPDHIERHLLTPIGLHGSRFCERRPARVGEAVGYTLDQGVPTPATSDGLSPLFAAGGLCASAVDLIAWQRALAGGKVVSAASYARMTAPAGLDDGSRASYGFGMMLGRIGEHRMIGHGGGIEGFASQLSHFPDDDVTVAVLANAEHAYARRLSEEIARVVLGIPAPGARDLPLGDAELARFPGIYALADDRLEVWAIGGRLAARLGNDPPYWLRYQGDATFVAEPDPTLEFRFTVRGGRARAVVLTVAGLKIDAPRLP